MTELKKYIIQIEKYYKFKPLADAISNEVRRYYKKCIPDYLCIDGADEALMSKSGVTICKRYDRIVIGDYGPYIEFSKENIYEKNIVVTKGQEWRTEENRWSKNCKYIWLNLRHNEDIKVYLQTKTVKYADYIPGKYYVSVEDIYPKRLVYLWKSRKYRKENNSI